MNWVPTLALTALLAGCAGFPAMDNPFSSLSSATAEEAALPGRSSEISVAALDPLDVPPPASPATSPASPLLVPAPAEASQRVPLGTLNASSDPAPALRPPTVLVPGAQAASSVPAPAPAPAPVSATPPAATPAPASPPPEPPPAVVAQAPTPSPPPPAAAAPEPSAPPQPVTPAPVRAAPPPPEEEETMIISSATAPPAVQGREFIPASVIPVVAPPAPPALGEMPFTQAERNAARRFDILARLRDGGLITQDEFNRRRAANLGALLPYSQDPPGVGLDRSVPSGDAIVARLGALRRSFEIRAITAQQHALERTMILNALLPESPEQRTARRAPPEDVLQGAAMVGRLETLREGGVITQAELEAERRMIDTVLRTGLFPPRGGEAAKPAAQQAKAAAKPAAPPTSAAAADNPMATPITGPVLHLASFRSEASARQGWQEVLTRNKAALGPFKPIIRRVDLGQGKGIFYRLMTGSFASMAEAESVCVRLKQNNQFCRASADGT